MKRSLNILLVGAALCMGCQKAADVKLTTLTQETPSKILLQRSLGEYSTSYENALNSATDNLRATSKFALSDIAYKKAAFNSYTSSLAHDLGIPVMQVYSLISSMKMPDNFTGINPVGKIDSVYTQTINDPATQPDFKKVMVDIVAIVDESISYKELAENLDQVNTKYQHTFFGDELKVIASIAKQAALYWPLHMYDWQYYKRHIDDIPLNNKIRQILKASVEGACVGTMSGSVSVDAGIAACIGSSYAAGLVAFNVVNGS